MTACEWYRLQALEGLFGDIAAHAARRLRLPARPAESLKPIRD